MFGERDTPSVALIGHPNVQHFTPIPLHKREANMLYGINSPLVATLNQRETLMHVSIQNRENPVMKFPLNQGGHPNLMHISINKR